jgi:septin family protein
MPLQATGEGKKKIRLRATQVFRFNVMVVGESGLGKSTFLRTLFKMFVSDISRLVPQTSAQEPEEDSVEEIDNAAGEFRALVP